MTDQDNLRDRIAKVLDQNFNPDQYPIMAAMFRDYAQTIIDEFGLTMESRLVYATDLARDDEPVTDDMAQRIVGKWVKQ